jgi:hypothetical protein
VDISFCFITENIFFVFFKIIIFEESNMANRNAIFGARLVGHLYGSSYNARVRSYIVPSSDADALYLGDFVTMAGSGETNDIGQTYPTVEKTAAGQVITGVIVGFVADSDNLNQIYRSASTERTVFVCDDPYAIFEIQTDGTAIAGDFGSNADIVLGTPSDEFGTSGTQLDQTTVTAATAQLRILGLSQRVDNELGQYAKFLCMVNEHTFKQTAGV